MSSGELPGATRQADDGLTVLTAGEIVSAMATAERSTASRLIAELMRRFNSLTRRIWLSAGGNPTEHDDFRQTVWIKLLADLPRLERPEAFAGFFRQLAVRHAIDEVRKARRREQHLIPLDEEEWPELATEHLERIDNAILVRSFLEALPRRERVVLELMFEQDLSSSEVAKILGLTEGAVRMTKSRGINRLRALVQTGIGTDAKNLGER